MPSLNITEGQYAQGQKDCRAGVYNSPLYNFINMMTCTKEQAEENIWKAITSLFRYKSLTSTVGGGL